MPPKVRRDPLQTIPGIGPSIAADLRQLGITNPTGLRGKDPERLYARSNRLKGVVQDRCLRTRSAAPSISRAPAAASLNS